MQCHNFNKDWTFEKADQADRLKAFYGNSNAAVSYTHLKIRYLVQSLQLKSYT